jgi:hypothetical protein
MKKKILLKLMKKDINLNLNEEYKEDELMKMNLKTLANLGMENDLINDL